MVSYYSIIASKNFLLYDEPMEEVLRERVHYYRLNKKEIDFWILPSPSFLKSTKKKEIINNLKGDALAIVSTNKIFIQWLKLRIQNVAIVKFEAPNDTFLSPLKFSN